MREGFAVPTRPNQSRKVGDCSAQISAAGMPEPLVSGVDGADHEPGAVFFPAQSTQQFSRLAANAVVTRAAVRMPALGVVLNEAARIYGSRTALIGRYSGEGDHQALTNEWQQWVDSGPSPTLALATKVAPKAGDA